MRGDARRSIQRELPRRIWTCSWHGLWAKGRPHRLTKDSVAFVAAPRWLRLQRHRGIWVALDAARSRLQEPHSPDQTCAFTTQLRRNCVRRRRHGDSRWPSEIRGEPSLSPFALMRVAIRRGVRHCEECRTPRGRVPLSGVVSVLGAGQWF